MRPKSLLIANILPVYSLSESSEVEGCFPAKGGEITLCTLYKCLDYIGSTSLLK